MKRLTPQTVAEVIRDSPVSHAARKRMIKTFVDRFAGERLDFDMSLFIIVASNGRWETYRDLMMEQMEKEHERSAKTS